MSYCFVFVCQAGELEIQSLLLAASLRRNLGDGCECIAAIPQPSEQWGTVPNDTLALLHDFNVHTMFVNNPIGPDYPTGNKINCLGVPASAECLVFLDSDILCLRPFSLSAFRAPFSAKPADVASFTRDAAIWRRIYRLFRLSEPPEQVITTVSGELTPLYFNAGVVAVQNGLNFAAQWAECCRIIDASPDIPNKRPWLDQIALPITVKRLKLAHHCLDERFNHPTHLKPLSNSLPFLCHYHWPTVLRREPALNRLVNELAANHPALKEKLSHFPDWAKLLKPYALRGSIRRRSFLFPFNTLKKSKQFDYARPLALITGVPRSGTSYLCRLMHTLQDCVAVNEPMEIFSPLIEQIYPWEIAVFHQKLRARILDGEPIENKINQGQLIEDTAVADQRSSYHPQVSRPDFLLCTKNTLSYLARLEQIEYVLPDTPIIACIRHPLDTIASWKGSFPHLKQASVEAFPIGHPNDPFLPAWRRKQLQEIANQTSHPLKRALLWRYLAECLLKSRRQIILVYYEELVRQPIAVLHKLLAKIPDAPAIKPLKKITASSARHKRELLDETDIQAITDICSEPARELGYHDL